LFVGGKIMAENEQRHDNSHIKSPYMNLSWLIYIALLVVGVILAKSLFDGLGISTSYNLKLNIYIYDVILLAYGFISCVLFYQLGKMIFSIIGGFRVVYFNLCLIGFKKNKDGKIVVYNGAKEDFSIRVQVAPKKDNPNIKLSLWGGSITLLIVIVLTYALIFLLNASVTTKYFFILSSFFYFFSFAVYMIPCRMDHLNDGFVLHLIKKENAKDVYLRNLINIEKLYLGDPELVYCDYGDALDPLRTEGVIYNYYYLMDHNKIQEANALAEKYVKYTKYFIEEAQVNTIIIGNIYSMCLQEKFEELEQYYWKLDTNTRHIFASSKSYESLKTAFYIAGFIDVEYEQYEKVVKSIEKTKNKYRYLARIEPETKLMTEARNKCLEKHPEWND
jgi:hypothetical protein